MESFPNRAVHPLQRACRILSLFQSSRREPSNHQESPEARLGPGWGERHFSLPTSFAMETAPQAYALLLAPAPVLHRGSHGLPGLLGIRNWAVESSPSICLHFCDQRLVFALLLAE